MVVDFLGLPNIWMALLKNFAPGKLERLSLTILNQDTVRRQWPLWSDPTFFLQQGAAPMPPGVCHVSLSLEQFSPKFFREMLTERTPKLKTLEMETDCRTEPVFNRYPELFWMLTRLEAPDRGEVLLQFRVKDIGEKPRYYY